MRVFVSVLLVLFLLVACESPQDTNDTQTLYKGRVVQDNRAPFLVNPNSLAKQTDGLLIIDEEVSAGTVYGLEADTAVYAADGGETLPPETWIDNLSEEPIEVDVQAKLVITFETLTTVTLIDAEDVIYIDANGDEVEFSGTGVISTTEIETLKHGSVTLISTTKFAIGGEGGENG